MMQRTLEDICYTLEGCADLLNKEASAWGVIDLTQLQHVQIFIVAVGEDRFRVDNAGDTVEPKQTQTPRCHAVDGLVMTAVGT